MKYKILSTGTLVTCDGSRHTYKAIDEAKLKNQPNSALCWCHNADHEQLERWSNTEEEAQHKPLNTQTLMLPKVTGAS